MRCTSFLPQLLALAVLTPAGGALAEDATKPPGAPSAIATGAGETLKERLSDKASDDQRVDNCNVPIERRGPKIRPDTCSHEAARPAENTARAATAAAPD